MLSTRTVPDAPAAAGGFTIRGNPTEAAKSRICSRKPLPRDWAQGIPPFRSASFIAGLSRQRNAVWTEVPGTPQASRTRGGHDVGLDRGLEPSTGSFD
jgi:hypothetical protein